ncbi:MAG: CdaR family transcriptional regulator [Lachnospiraceae bacterium]|nr:CdaR family transcriptional regulator [Lachnospiraceae bacterium]
MFYDEIAKKFIERLTAYTEYNINIMDEKGIIIASRNPERIGTFHEIAFDIVTNKKSMIEVTENSRFLGVYPGVNLLLTQNGTPIGVIGVTGEPQEVKPIALIIKMAMETMLEYEYQKELSNKRQNLKERFIHQLLYDRDPDPLELRTLAEKLNYKEEYLRIPILCNHIKEKRPESIQKKIKTSSLHTSQDISIITRNKQVLIFKTLPKQANIFSDYRDIVLEYLDTFVLNTDQYQFYIGTIQDRFSNYQTTFGHCTWLQNHVVSDSKSMFFYDHLDDYMKDSIPKIELHKVFHCFKNELSEKDILSYLEIIGTLKKNNYNMTTSSDELYIHKNTLAFRLNKIRNKMNLNPFLDIASKEFMEYFYYYLKNT